MFLLQLKMTKIFMENVSMLFKFKKINIFESFPVCLLLNQIPDIVVWILNGFCKIIFKKHLF